jgi:hypothetical protein
MLSTTLALPLSLLPTLALLATLRWMATSHQHAD